MDKLCTSGRVADPGVFLSDPDLFLKEVGSGQIIPIKSYSKYNIIVIYNSFIDIYF